MRWFRWRDRKLDDWAEAIRPELRDLPTPPPDAALWKRIASSRAAGSRVILPEVTNRAPHSKVWPYVIPAALAAAIVLVAVPFGTRTDRDSTSRRESDVPPVASQWFSGAVALAEPASNRDSAAAPIQFKRANRLRPVTLEYSRTWRDSTGALTGQVRGLLTMRREMVDGIPAWRLVSRDSGFRNGRNLIEEDSVFMAHDDLRVLRRTALVAPYLRYDEIRIRQVFKGDSVLGRMNAKGADASAAGRPIARTLPAARGPFITDAFAPILLGAVELHAGWSGSASLIGWAVVHGDVFIPIEIRVEGSEEITVPAGRFDCWRMSIRHDGRKISHWVRKSDGIGVRMLQTSRTAAAKEMVLLRGTVE